MASFSELRVLQEEEKSLISLMSRFSDQLTRLKVEELALVSMLRREAEEKEAVSNNEQEVKSPSVNVRNIDTEEDLDLNVQDPFSLAFQQLEEEEDEDEAEEEDESDEGNEMDDLNMFLRELTAKHNQT